jgi:predicted dehydrogenase
VSGETGTLRVGVVGAGGNTRKYHIPNLKAQPGVEIVSVANRSRESGERAAKDFGIPRVYDTWQQLVDADDTNAICIGTWPYLHAPVTIAALARGKHVLCEARMAMNAAEGHAMLAASRRAPHLVAQLVPAPHTLWADATLQALIADGYLGDVLAVEVRAVQGKFVDREAPLHWRQDESLSGFNALTMARCTRPTAPARPAPRTCRPCACRRSSCTARATRSARQTRSAPRRTSCRRRPGC